MSEAIDRPGRPPRIGRRGPTRKALYQLIVFSAFAALFVLGPAAGAAPFGVALNEVNCTGTDWVELINHTNTEVSVGNWLLTDDALDRVPSRDSHRMRFASDAVLGPGARLVVTQGVGGFPFGLSCGDDTLRLADATDTPVDAVTLPVLATAGMTYGRIPEGTGDWTWTLPTAGTVNEVASDEQNDVPAWLFDPLQVTEIDLEAGQAALSQLAAAPDAYVDAQITLRHDADTYGPYLVGLRLKGHTAFRPLEGKAAFKIKFGYSVGGQHFFGLKALTLNNMVQDPSMIAESTASLAVAATGAPTVRVGYAYVRLNGAEYGLYANVETVDAVMAQRWSAGTQHIYEGSEGIDASPGRSGEFDVDEGSSTDRSDLEALSAANAAGASGWWERMQAVADLTEMTRVWAAEHYIGHWDGYSINAEPLSPNNYYLQSDLAGRFSLIADGTDQAWTLMERAAFGVYGNGVLMRGCVADVDCEQLYVDALRQIAAGPAIAALPAEARAIRDAIAPWRARDPRREQTVADGEAQADAKIAAMDARPAELAAWLASPSFVAAVPPPPPEAGGGGGGGSGPSDLSVTGTVTPTSSPVGGSHVWRLEVKNTGGGVAPAVALDVRFSPNSAYGFSQVTRGNGCVPVGPGLHCELDALADNSTVAVVLGTNVTAPGEVSLTATASSAQADPTPADNTVFLKANLAPAAASQNPSTQRRPVLGKPVGTPAKPVAGERFTFSLPVTRSDTGTSVLTGKLICDPSVAGRVIAHVESFKGGKARLSFIVPKTAKGKVLKVNITITASGQGAGHTYSYVVR